MPSGNQPEPMLAQIYVTLWRHSLTMSEDSLHI